MDKYKEMYDNLSDEMKAQEGNTGRPDYDIDVKLCAFTASEMSEASKVYEGFE